MAVLCEMLTTLDYLCDCLSGTPPHGRFNCIRQVAPVCTPPNTCFLGPIRVHNPNGSHFCTAHGRASLYFTMGRPLPSKLTLPTGGSGSGPHLRHGSTRVFNPNGVSIGSAVFVGLTTVTDRQTDDATGPVVVRCGVIMCLKMLTAVCAGAGVHEHCDGESFRAACYQPDEVLTITHAQYGIMPRGRCVDDQRSDTGCYADVTRQVAGVCSGRRSCDLEVNSDRLKADSCPAGSAFSLNASFTCVKGLKPPLVSRYKNSPGDEIANVNFFFDDIVHV